MTRCKRDERTRGKKARAAVAGLLGWLTWTGLPAPAHAEDDAECPPGAFCTADPSTIEQAAAEEPAGEPAAARSATVPSADAEGSVTVVLPPPPKDRSRTTVVRQRPGAAPEIVAYEVPVQRPRASTGDSTSGVTPDPDDANGDTTWGLQIRGSGMLLPQRHADLESPSMAGGGVSLRYRPVSPLAFDVGLDVLMGIDSNGFQRHEVPISASLLLYLIPDAVIQPYAFFGLSLAHAQVDANRFQPNLAEGLSDRYTYVGGHAGLGIDLRIASALSLSFDGFGYVRERVDANANRYPEFYDRRTGEASNTTVAGQLRGGVTFWW